MKITPQNLINHELIGLKVIVHDHTNPSFKNINGIVVYETKNMLHIKNPEGKVYKISKKDGVFRFIISDDCIVEVDGKIINKRPEDRIKIHLRRRW
ncbi:MAG: ribonuclease P protein component 1 [Candidatus Asgardarchaeia archaeon]